MAWLGRIANLWRRRKIDDDIEAELRAHLELRADDNVAAGMAQEDARRDAGARFGNVTLLKERTRAAELNQFFENFWRDVSYAVRQLRRSPGFAATAVVTLGLAMAANVVVFGVLNALVLEPLQGDGAGRLFNVVQGQQGNENQSYPDYLDYQRYNSTFAGLAAYRLEQIGLVTKGRASTSWGYEVSGNYFDTMGLTPALGRFFHATDEHGPDSAPYVVLSDAFWRSHFNANPQVIGTTVRLNEHPFTVLGVAPPSFHGTDLFLWADFWMPIINERQIAGYSFLENRYTHNLWIIGRLKPGVTTAQATDNLNAIAARLGRQYPKTDDGMTARLVKPGLMGDELGDAARAFLSAIMLLALLVLVTACVNLASIFAARAADRGRELAIRLAIGSSRWQVLRQMMVEGIAISLLGGALGTLCAAVLLHLLSGWQPFADLPIHVTVTPDARVYGLAMLLSIMSGVLPGLLPIRQLWRIDLVHAMRNAVGEGALGRRLSLRDLLLGVQIALCALLLTASLVALRGMERSLHAPFGFNPQGVTLAATDMHMSNYSDANELPVQKRLIEAAAGIPGVVAVGTIDETPLGTGGSNSSVYPEGTTDFRPSKSRFSAKYFSISPGYLRSAETRLLAGRDFTWRDDAKAPPVALVNETFAHRLFGDAEAVGRRFMGASGTTIEIVGVLENGKYGSLTEAPTAAMFFPVAQNPNGDTTLVVRSRLSARETEAALAKVLPAIDPSLPFNIRSWNAGMALMLFPARVATVSLGVMGLLAAMLAVTGVFGMAAYSVSKRKKEFAIRMALGSRAGQLLQAALARPVVLLLTGSTAGLALGVLASSVLQQIVYDATPRDPLVWAGVVMSMVALGVAATWIPARRALRIDPAKLLKEDA